MVLVKNMSVPRQVSHESELMFTSGDAQHLRLPLLRKKEENCSFSPELNYHSFPLLLLLIGSWSAKELEVTRLASHGLADESRRQG